LDGATSSAVYALTLTKNQQPFELVLRLFTNKEWLADEPDLARHEADCLLLAQQLDVSVPELVAVDEDGRFTHHPAILMTKLPGQVQLNPINLPDWLQKLAATLIKIHTLPAPNFPWPYFSWLNLDNFQVPAWAQSPQLWQEALEIVSQPPPDEPTIFIHRDYHPTNVLWQGETISGVVDWVNGCRGPISEDISHCRSNLFAMYGLEAADHFLAAYQALAPASFTYNPYWDVATVMDMDSSADPFDYPPWRQFGLKLVPVPVLREQTERFLANAMSQLR
jgi:aminoglycoside phosphotransferase (APT) family kinase protein